MSESKILRYVATNDFGVRIGQDHPRAVLSDIEVDALILDRGPEDAPLMSYSQLAKKYGISKSCVRDILTGRRRGQAQKMVNRPEIERIVSKKVRVNLKVTLRARSLLHRIGGGAWIDSVAARIDSEMRCARTDDPNVVIERVLRKLCVTK